MTVPTKTLTAGEIAQFIQRRDEPLGSAIARFRNWEKVGIIKSTSKRNPGTGHKKQYEASALLESMLLQTISDNVGAPVIFLQPVVEKLSEVVRAGAFSWGSEVLVLQKVGGESEFELTPVNLKQLPKFISDSKHNVHVVLNLSRMFSAALPYFHEDLDVPEWYQRIMRALESKKLHALASARREHELAEEEKDGTKRKRSAKSKSKS